MRNRLLTAVISAIILISLSSCGGSDVIPRRKLAMIYAEMFVADQWIISDTDARRMADTTLVYEPIFEKYGYTSDDYRRSMDVYMSDPDRYARILRKSSLLIEDKIKDLKKQKKLLESLSRLKGASEAFLPEKIFFLTGIRNPDLLVVDSVRVYIDSTGGAFMFDVQKGYDTLFAGPAFRIVSDTVVVADTVSAVPEIPGVPSVNLPSGAVDVRKPFVNMSVDKDALPVEKRELRTITESR